MGLSFSQTVISKMSSSSSLSLSSSSSSSSTPPKTLHARDDQSESSSSSSTKKARTAPTADITEIVVVADGGETKEGEGKEEKKKKTPSPPTIVIDEDDVPLEQTRRKKLFAGTYSRVVKVPAVLEECGGIDCTATEVVKCCTGWHYACKDHSTIVYRYDDSDEENVTTSRRYYCNTCFDLEKYDLPKDGWQTAAETESTGTAAGLSSSVITQTNDGKGTMCECCCEARCRDALLGASGKRYFICMKCYRREGPESWGIDPEDMDGEDAPQPESYQNYEEKKEKKRKAELKEAKEQEAKRKAAETAAAVAEEEKRGRGPCGIIPCTTTEVTHKCFICARRCCCTHRTAIVRAHNAPPSSPVNYVCTPCQTPD